MEIITSCPSGQEVPGPVNSGPLSRTLYRNRSEMGYECPESDLREICKSSHARTESHGHAATSASSSRAQSPVKSKGKRKAISSSSGRIVRAWTAPRRRLGRRVRIRHEHVGLRQCR
ncbi:hypothetical protein EVAR_91264_1 [Eumeta japonica]|uniref:Uncharacterized protein n=1 Tax=Eumeta variegata TaxID=151549 RepID=A0A4C1T4U6_EUMVA|nr:hypothetical protein EVAR_91264_1 [Eumeta japonica]